MKILAFDTSMERSSVALAEDGRLLGAESAEKPREQLTWLIPAAEELLKRNHLAFRDLSGVALTVGPGSFTGLRLAAVTARTLSQVLSLPLTAFNTLDIIAWNVFGEAPQICSAIDARKGEIFCALYEGTAEGPLRKTDILAVTPEEFIARLRLWCGKGRVALTGNALGRYGDLLRAETPPGTCFFEKPRWYPEAAVIVRLADPLLRAGKGLSWQELSVFYLRRPEAVVAWEMRHGS